MVYIVGKGRLVTVNVASNGKVVETFVVRKSRMHGDNVVYEGKEYPLRAGNIIEVGPDHMSENEREHILRPWKADR